MASSIIHIAVANEINKILKRDKQKILIGSIAPDIAKLTNESKDKLHFIDKEKDIPNINNFLKKYEKNLNDDFVMGDYIHLYTDYLWYKYFMTEILKKDMITKKDGTTVKLNGDMARLYIYNDYTNLNIQLIEKYNLDLKIFYNKIPQINNIIEEIPTEKIDILINNADIIIANTKLTKSFIFDITDTCKFIDTAAKLFLTTLKKDKF